MSAPFTQAVQTLNGKFGTEAAAPLLYALARFIRPRRVFEVGAGLSSLYLLQALADCAADCDADQSSERNIYGKTQWYDDPYQPRLMTLDDQSHECNTVENLRSAVEELQLSAYFDLRKEVFEGFAAKMPKDMLPLDMIWFDCGGAREYIDFTLQFWPLLNPDGGIIVYHSTMTNADLRVFLRVLMERQNAGREFELLNLLEPHKKLQNSVSILRRHSGSVAPLYTWEP